MAIGGWFIILILIWDLTLKGGVTYYNANHFGELWIEFILINCIFILLIIFFIFELKEMFNEKRKEA